MTFKEVLSFIGDCLALAKYPERRDALAKKIQLGQVDWLAIVNEGSNQMMIPAIYLNLKRAKLLADLPEDLVLYFQEITQLNLERNKAILHQVTDLAILLDEHKIKPLFLKGTAHLIENLYQDLAERMVGDIDFLVPKQQVEKVVTILKTFGYTNLLENEVLEKPRHYSRLVHKDYIASVEIHWDVLEQYHKHSLDYEMLFKARQKFEKFSVPSYAHQAIYNMLNAQVNDHSYSRGIILVRQLYDGFLLSSQTDAVTALNQYKYDYFLKKIYLSWLFRLFKPEHFKLQNNVLVHILMLRYLINTNEKLNRLYYFTWRIYNYPRQLILAFSNKSKRKNIIKSLTTPGWMYRHLKSYTPRNKY